MDYGQIKNSRTLVHAAKASRGVSYVCPTCGQPLELRRGPDLEYFAHWRGLEGTRECELFVPGHGADLAGSAGPASRGTQVENDLSELGLILDQLDGEWRVGLRLPEIPPDELGDVSLNELRPARVDVTVGGAVVSRISALDLRPGVGAARVQVPPTVQEYQARVAGSWPRTIDTLRWQLRSRGLEAQGTLFRLRGGEWTRLLGNSGVHYGERLLVVAEARSSRPRSIVTEEHTEISSGGLRWMISEVRLPDESVESVTAWLTRLGHEFVPGPWSVELATPPRALDEGGDPVFWVGDSPVLTLEAPQAGAEALVSVEVGTNSHNASAKAPESRRVHVAITSQNAEEARISVFAERSANLQIAFVERPSRESLLEMLTKTPRLRVWIGEQVIEAWQTPTYKVAVASRASPEVRIELGADSARARVTVWERGKQGSISGLDARNAARLIETALPTASRIELDADNFGRVEIVPQRVTTDASHRTPMGRRLSWHDHAMSLIPRPEEGTTPALLQRPRPNTSLVAQRVGAAALVRTRLALRRRHRARGDP